jgi:PleD family two-component response regulator
MPDKVPTSDEPQISLSIVALDDDEDFRQYIRSVLEADGHDVRVCATPEELFTACGERCPIACCSTSRWAAIVVTKS